MCSEGTLLDEVNEAALNVIYKVSETIGYGLAQGLLRGVDKTLEEIKQFIEDYLGGWNEM